jgi:hypothetical protein
MDSLNDWYELMGGTFLAHEVEIEDVGMADSRMEYDADCIDCSRTVFRVTTEMMMQGCKLGTMIFPSRRWRNFRNGEEITNFPIEGDPVLFIGNPILIHAGTDGLTVIREPSFRIKSGMEMGF